MWNELGALGAVGIYQSESLYTCEINGNRLSLYCDLEKTEREMLKISPEDENEIKALTRAVKNLKLLLGIGGDKHNMKACATESLYLAPSLIKYFNITARELSLKFRHPLLRLFIRSFWGEDFGAIALITVFATFTGANGGLPEGGSHKMAERISERFTSLGGRLLVQHEAVKINCDAHLARSVTFQNGETVETDYIVLACDPASIFGTVLDASLPKGLQRRYNSPAFKSFSSYQCAFSCDSDSLPFIGDFIFEVPVKYRALLNSREITLREYSHEPSFAPKGKNIIQTITFCLGDYALGFIEEKEYTPEEYKRHKEKLASVIKHIIILKFPELNGKLQCIDVWTPATYKRYTGAPVGSYMSFILPKKHLPASKGNWAPGLKNVILATQWQTCPGGLPTAAEHGRKAARQISKRELILSKKHKTRANSTPFKKAAEHS
jgi:phytoene dehydrogenase-like protein